jgi:ribosome recycling factor
MPVDDILMDCEMAMDKAVEHLKQELRGVRTGRATPAMVEHIRVDYYGSQQEIRAIASINIPEASQILIKPFDQSTLKLIEKAINDAKLPLTPHSDGKTLRLVLPPMSQEVRVRMVASVKTHGETAKVVIRNIRRDANKLLDTEKKGGVITEDEDTRSKESVQELTKQYEGKVEEMVEHKRKEIMEI